MLLSEKLKDYNNAILYAVPKRIPLKPNPLYNYKRAYKK